MRAVPMAVALSLVMLPWWSVDWVGVSRKEEEGHGPDGSVG